MTIPSKTVTWFAVYKRMCVLGRTCRVIKGIYSEPSEAKAAIPKFVNECAGFASDYSVEEVDVTMREWDTEARTA